MSFLYNSQTTLFGRRFGPDYFFLIMAMIGQIVLDKKLGVICMIIFEAQRRFFLCSQVLLIQISIFSLLFQFISNIRQFTFVFGMFENWKTLFHSDPDKMELSVEFLQSFLLALQKEYGIPSWEYVDCMYWCPWNMMIIFWLKKINAGLKKKIILYIGTASGDFEGILSVSLQSLI